jgi:HrpA-like RNA helicase
MVGEKKIAMPGERVRLPGERTLPVRRSKDLIIDKVKLNRVTLVSADTGSGTRFLSSIVDLFLLRFVVS